MNDSYWVPGSDAPVFLCVGGEGPPLDGTAVRSVLRNSYERLACNDGVVHMFVQCWDKEVVIDVASDVEEAKESYLMNGGLGQWFGLECELCYNEDLEMCIFEDDAEQTGRALTATSPSSISQRPRPSCLR